MLWERPIFWEYAIQIHVVLPMKQFLFENLTLKQKKDEYARNIVWE